ncbi:YggS family pyridoxal phosphate-dependent enzyme [Bacillus sp. 165]|uniref:YggS family pyridoxal phosphate-dependent enzyme n=1 Tax=Bacillus sp. 165 TaxID=1529117 RepID=UPI001ADBD769|nr:YggS family pyridoxal phosphate-dependent enzyme [Bacillus sp. 165]
MSVAENVQQVQNEIKAACERVQRSAEEVKLIAVTKTVGLDVTNEVLASGIRHIGENRNEGFLQKHDQINENAIWHFIGSIQTRKIKDIINKIDFLHSLDRLSLAAEIQKRADKKVNCFVQVNTSFEEAKHGLHPDEVLAFVQELHQYDKIKVVGLMTMAPFTDEEQRIRTCFQTLKKVQQGVQALHLEHAPCKELSMGMSNDYTIAIEEGATYIRLGTILVGEKQ